LRSIFWPDRYWRGVHPGRYHSGEEVPPATAGCGRRISDIVIEERSSDIDMEEKNNDIDETRCARNVTIGGECSILLNLESFRCGLALTGFF
jgi:hypothetical protein